MIISEMTSHDEGFYSLSSAPRLVSKPDVHIGYNPIYEYGALPSAADIRKAIDQVMEA